LPLLAEAAPLQSFDNHGPSTVQPLRAGQSEGLHCYSVYNEKSTIDEIVRRVLDTSVRKEVIIIDDCSTDGTRQILENMAARQANGEASAPAQDGGDQVELRDLRFFSGAEPRQGSCCGAVCASKRETSC